MLSYHERMFFLLSAKQNKLQNYQSNKETATVLKEYKKQTEMPCSTLQGLTGTLLTTFIIYDGLMAPYWSISAAYCLSQWTIFAQRQWMDG